MITRKAEYAIIILAELASHPSGTTVTSREIAEKRSIPANLVVQLLSQLNRAGWTSGTRGPSGGIRLISDPAQLTLREVIKEIDGAMNITRCLNSDKPCQGKKSCSLRETWIKAQQCMLSELEMVTIKDIAENS